MNFEEIIELSELIDDDDTLFPEYTALPNKASIIKYMLECLPEECHRSIIGGADHDIIYLCDEEVAERFTKEQIIVLLKSNVFADYDDGCLAMYA